MDIQGFSRIPNTSLESGGLNSPADRDNGSKFITDLLAVAQSQSKPEAPQVNAGQSKEFDFWTKDEKIAHKQEKLRTLDDALAEIDRIMRDLKQES